MCGGLLPGVGSSGTPRTQQAARGLCAVSLHQRSPGCWRKSANKLVREGRDRNILTSSSAKVERTPSAGDAEGGGSHATFLRCRQGPSARPAADPHVPSQLHGVHRGDLHDHQGPQPRAPSLADQAALLRVQIPTSVKRGKVTPGLHCPTCC